MKQSMNENKNQARLEKAWAYLVARWFVLQTKVEPE